MITLLCGWLVGWLMNGLSDAVALARVPGAAHPTWHPLGGLWHTPRPRFAILHTMTEILSLIVGAAIGLRCTPDQTIPVMSVYAFLLFITLTDMKYHRVFNVATYPAVLIVLLWLLISPAHTSLPAHIMGGGLAFGIFMVAAITTRGGLGGGDIKLAGLLGLAFGFPNILWVLLVGTGLGALLALGALFSRRATLQTRVAYAPFLCIGALIVLLVLAR